MIKKSDFIPQLLRLDAMFFPGKFSGEVGEELIKDYYRSLKNMRIDDLVGAVSAIIDDDSADFRGFNFPGPGQIRLYIRTSARNRIAREEVKRLAEPVDREGQKQIEHFANKLVKRI